ncbi:MAG: hypothetical protein ACR2NF_08080, partial [Pirellulales bacterium]
SSVPTSPPIFEANYYGFSYQAGDERNPGRINGTRTYLGTSPLQATRGVAVRSESLVFKLPDAIKGTSIGGSGSLGIVPGTVRGTVKFGVDEGDNASIPSNTFQDRKNIGPVNGFLEQTGYSLFFENLNEASADIPRERQWGKPYYEPSPDDFELINHVQGPDGQRQLGVAGYVRNQSELFMKISSYSGSGDTPNVGYSADARPLQGFNINVTDLTLKNGKAVDAVRVEDVSFLVFVKPTSSNDVTFAPGGTIERNVTVDLLSDGSSVFVNSPIQVAELGGDLDFRATNIFVNAETTSPDYFFLGRSENQNSERLPRADDPQGGTRQTPTFNTVIPDEVITKQVNAIPVIEGDAIKDLIVLPGNEGYGYDPSNPPTVSFGNPGITTADVEIAAISGGVDQLILLGSGGGYPLDSEQISVQFTDPQLRRIEELPRWTSTPPSEGYTAAPVLAISQPEVVLSAVRIGHGERGRSRAADGDGLGIRLTDSGDNYSSEPNVKVQLTQQAKNAGIEKYNPNIARDLEWARSMPSLVLEMDLKAIAGSTGGKNPIPTSTYVYGKVGSIKAQDPGWGLNLTGMDRSSEASFLADINERFEIVISGGNSNPGLGATTQLIGWPVGGTPTHATFEFNRAVLGGLKWQNVPTTNGQDPVQDERALLNAGLNYQLSPDVQFFTNLTADVPEPFGPPAPGENTRELVDVPPSPQGSVLPADLTYATHKISLNNVFAYRDDSGYDSEGNRFDRTKFRDVDYLSYANDPLHKDNVVAKVSNDGITFYDVLVQPFIGLGDTYKEIVDLSIGGNTIAISAEIAGELSAGDFVAGGTIPSNTTISEIFETTARAQSEIDAEGRVLANPVVEDAGQNY